MPVRKLVKLVRISGLAWAAAVLYCSWPLGYVLNPGVARSELASVLQSPGQPFAWVFVMTDVLAGVAAILAGVLQLRRHRSRMATYAIFGYMTFGFLVATGALIPLDCNPEVQQCGIVHDPLLIMHGFCSILSVFALFVSLALLIRTRPVRSRTFRYVYAGLFVGWVFFGLGSLVQMIVNTHGNTLQQFFITLCSLTVLAVVYSVEHLAKSANSVAAEVPKPAISTSVDT